MDLDLKTRLLDAVDAVDAAFDDQVAFLAALAAMPSTRGNEQPAQTLMAEALGGRALAVDRWRIALDDIRDRPGFSPVLGPCEDAVNVVGSHRSRTGKGRSLILNGHIDVVPAGTPDMWDSPPFAPRVADGRMYVCGAGDMKAGLPANLYALDALIACGFAPAADVFFQSVAEEECTGNGALACAILADAARETAFLKNALPEVVWHGFLAGGYARSEDPSATAAQAIGTLEAAHSAVTGDALDRLAITATTDARFFGLYADTPALVYGRRAEAIHGFNERVELESLRRVTRATVLFIADWCGVETI